MSSKDKVYCYLQSLDTNINNNVGTTFEESHLDTDTGIKVNYYSQSPKDDSSIPYLDVSDNSPTFKIPFPLESTTSVKKNLFKEHPKSPNNKIHIIQNVILEPSKIQKHHEEVKLPNRELCSSKSFSSNSENSFDVDYCIPSTSTSADDDSLPNYSQPACTTVSSFCYKSCELMSEFIYYFNCR